MGRMLWIKTVMVHLIYLAWLIGAVCFLLRLPLCFTPLSYSTDIWRQADTASIAHHFLHNGFHLFYPQVFWGGAGPGYIETEFQLYPFLVSLLYALLGEHLWLGRLLSLLLSVPTVLLFYRLARLVVEEREALLGTCFFAISPLYMRYSVAFMPEATVMFFYLLSLYLFHCWLQKQDLSVLLLCGAATALAILVKPTAIHIGLIFLVLLLKRLGRRGLWRRDIWVFAALSLLPAVAWYLHARHLYLRYGNTFGILSGGDSKFGDLGYWTSPAFYLSLINLDREWLFTNAGALVFVAGLVLSLMRRRPALLFIGSATILVYYMIVARYAQARWGLQYHVFALPYAALGVGIGLAWLLHPAQRPMGPVLAVLLSLAITGRTAVMYGGMLHPGKNSQIECGREVGRIVPPEARIIVASTSMSQDGGVPNNYQDPVVFFYSQRYGFSLPADRYTPDRLQALWRAGGSYLAVPGKGMFQGHPEMEAFLREHGEQIGPGEAAGCGIYRLR